MTPLEKAEMRKEMCEVRQAIKACQSLGFRYVSGSIRMPKPKG